MNFLLDVNASGIIARWLIEFGHDVVLVSEKNPRMSDDKILRWALREWRIIVTTDNDFEEMIWRKGQSHCARSERKALLRDVLEHHSHDLESGSIVIALSTKFRVWKPR